MGSKGGYGRGDGRGGKGSVVEFKKLLKYTLTSP